MDEDNLEDIEEDVEEREPQVTSSDPNERKFARKLRIERRLEAIRKLNMPEGEIEEETIEKTLLQQQLQKSFELLEKLTIEGNEFVTNVRVANDSREVDRREAEGIGREKIMEELEQEAVSAEEQFTAIAEKWTAILEYNDPLQINDEIISQKEKCDELIKQKDEIIAMLKNQIKTAEINFAKDQHKQNQDIETLADRIEKQVTMMRRAYRQELQLIEDVIMVERKMLIEVNDKKWEELYKKRDTEEEMNAQKKVDQLEEFEDMCYKLRINHHEKYRETKIKLENDIENLQQELEQIKTLALMNSEKLDYNYQILKKREDENIIIKSQQKRKINKLQDTINALRKKIRECTENTNTEIEHLTEDIIKLQNSVLDIEAKADHFSYINDVKYKQVWDLNRKRAGVLLDQILGIDRILFEQQLGVKWVHPEQMLLAKTDLPSYKSALQMVTDIFKKGEEIENAKDKSSWSVSDRMKQTNLLMEGETLAHRRILRLILHLIADKSGFLIEARLKEILQPFMDYERTLVRVDSVFSALGIKRKEDIEILFEYFLPYTHCPICMASAAPSIESSEKEIKTHNLIYEKSDSSHSEETSKPDETDSAEQVTNEPDIMSAIHQPDEVIEDLISQITEYAVPRETSSIHSQHFASSVSTIDSRRQSYSSSVRPEYESITTPQKEEKSKSLITSSGSSSLCQNRHPLIISSVYILRALREFISKFSVTKEGVITMTSRLSHRRSTVSRLIEGEEVKMFWERFREIFSQSKQELWDGLMIGLQKYHEILKDRKKLNDEVMGLRRQNLELKHLLSSYQKDQEKKMKPPCAMQREIPIKPTSL